MGLGDQLMATGMARGAKERGVKIAFGDGYKILWDVNSEQIFRGNPNIARPGTEHLGGLEWVRYYKGNRVYNRQDRAFNRWVWNMNFRPSPGEVFLAPSEIEQGGRVGSGFIVIEPNIEGWKSIAPNKDWGFARFQSVADRLKADGHRLVQFTYDRAGPALEGVEKVRTYGFRDALAIMSNAAMYLGPEGGLHHGAAAVGIQAAVIFGGFIPPAVTGYDAHVNIAGSDEFCGALYPCSHCRAAMDSISVDQVYEAAKDCLLG